MGSHGRPHFSTEGRGGITKLAVKPNDRKSVQPGRTVLRDTDACRARSEFKLNDWSTSLLPGKQNVPHLCCAVQPSGMHRAPARSRVPGEAPHQALGLAGPRGPASRFQRQSKERPTFTEAQRLLLDRQEGLSQTRSQHKEGHRYEMHDMDQMHAVGTVGEFLSFPGAGGSPFLACQTRGSPVIYPEVLLLGPPSSTHAQHTHPLVAVHVCSCDRTTAREPGRHLMHFYTPTVRQQEAISGT